MPAAAVKKYYDEHIDEFMRPEARRASVVIVASESEAKALLSDAKTSDLRAFRELVRTKSVDETNKLRGGDLHYFDATGQLVDETGQVDPALAKAAFALKTVGDISPVVKTGERYAIVKLTGQRAATEESVRQVEERIRMRLWRDRRQAAIDAKLDELRKRLQPEVHPELVDAVHLDAAAVTPPGDGLPPGFPRTRPTQPVIPGE
jgi:peptidyl-prolyl cis-trans isomerase C